MFKPSFKKASFVLLSPAIAVVVVLNCGSAEAQISINAGSYSQNFDSLATSGTANPWADNSTVPGWYASTGVTAVISTTLPIYRAGPGDSGTGALWSYGAAGINPLSDRALGALGSATFKVTTFGVRFANDTSATVTNPAVSFTGEMWRMPSGSGAVTNTLAFTYRVSNNPITDADAGNLTAGWTTFSALDFRSPYITTGSAFAIDGNNATNRQVFTNVVLSDVILQSGQELFLRWRKIDDIGSDGGLAIDDLTVGFNTTITPTPPSITTQPQSQDVTSGDNVMFSVIASGTSPFTYQWQFNGSNVDNETNAALTLNSVTTNWAGDFSVLVTNDFGFTNSDVATLTVSPSPPPVTNTLTLVHYNVKGNGTTDWSTNTAQVRAIGRVLTYLNPDIVTFNEIPLTNSWQLTNWAKDLLTGYNIAVNSGTDGFIRSAIASRFPITRSTSRLDGIDLKPFGYTNDNAALDNFTRDLFEAEIAVPAFPQHLHVFTTHLKSGGTSEDVARRAAEAAAITNFIATNMFVNYPLRPYVLDGDMNESNTNALSIQRLVSAPTGLNFTSPRNPVTGSINTFSIQASVNSRLDYIMPVNLLASNIRTSMVFRTDMLNPLPPNLNSSDSATASDHLPVLMVFNNPYDKQIQFTSIEISNTTVLLTWNSVIGQPYVLQSSSNLTSWATLAANLTATSNSFILNTNVSGDARYFRVYRNP